jgi:hypothetical protein
LGLNRPDPNPTSRSLLSNLYENSRLRGPVHDVRRCLFANLF